MKCLLEADRICNPGRSPCGERGLKYWLKRRQSMALTSLPVRGAWVEIACARTRRLTEIVAPRAGSVG